MNKLKVLIVEDEAIAAQLLKIQLTTAGYEIVGPSAKGEGAVKLALDEKPDVILMDINLLGKMDGIEASHLIQKTIKTKIIFMTGYDNPNIKQKASECTPLAYLIKPIEFNKLNEILSTIT